MQVTLSDISKWVDRDGVLQKLNFSRTPEIDKMYMQHRERVAKVFDNMGSYILFKYFGIHPRLATTKRDDGLYTIVLPLGYDEQRVVLNDYPYNEYGPNIKHMLVWSTRPLTYDECVSYANGIFMSESAHGIWFINRESARSVPQLWHMHVLVDMSSATMQKQVAP